MTNKEDIGKEASFFSATQNALTRQVAWSSIPYFQQRLGEALDLFRTIQQRLAGRKDLRALTLACGDMTGEYRLFSRLAVSHITAYDISPGQRDKFYTNYDGGIPVDYHIADVNSVELPQGTFDIAYMNQSLHHVEAVEHVVESIAHALAPGHGLFVLTDYIGSRFLQRTPKQREITARLWPHLPERLRRNHKGEILDKPHIPRKEDLSPYEAIRSDAILPALNAYFDPLKVLAYGGLLYPLINGFAQNYTDDDAVLLKMFWEMDQYMIEQSAIEPNFIRAIYVPRQRAA